MPATAQESAVTKVPPVDGIWLGTLPAGPQSLRIQIIVTSDSQGQAAPPAAIAALRFSIRRATMLGSS
jgi:hypothetical protein